MVVCRAKSIVTVWFEWPFVGENGSMNEPHRTTTLGERSKHLQVKTALTPALSESHNSFGQPAWCSKEWCYHCSYCWRTTRQALYLTKIQWLWFNCGIQNFPTQPQGKMLRTSGMPKSRLMKKKKKWVMTVLLDLASSFPLKKNKRYLCTFAFKRRSSFHRTSVQIGSHWFFVLSIRSWRWPSRPIWDPLWWVQYFARWFSTILDSPSSFPQYVMALQYFPTLRVDSVQLLIPVRCFFRRIRVCEHVLYH